MKTFFNRIKQWFMIETSYKVFAIVAGITGSMIGIFALKGFGTFTYPIAIWYLLSLYWRDDKLFSNKEIVIYIFAMIIDSSLYMYNHTHF